MSSAYFAPTTRIGEMPYTNNNAVFSIRPLKNKIKQIIIAIFYISASRISTNISNLDHTC